MKKDRFDYIIVGAGTCGLSIVNELNNKYGGRKILLLERGDYIKKVGRVIPIGKALDSFGLSDSIQGTIIYRLFGVGGTSIISGGNAVEPSEEVIDKIGIDFRKELKLAKIENSVGVNNFKVGKASEKIMKAANELGYDMHVMPKFGCVGQCVHCGMCTLGCRYSAKWTALEFLKNIDKERVSIISNCYVEKVISSNQRAIGVEGRIFNSKNVFFADNIILCAGGIGTPIIMQNSGLGCGTNFFADLFNITYGIAKGLEQSQEVAMSVVCDKFHDVDGFILSPLLDNFFTFLTNIEIRKILKVFKLRKMLGIMTKIKDDNIGRVYKNGKYEKKPTQQDLVKLKKGNEIAKEILIKCKVDPKSIIGSLIRGAHPGGTVAIGKSVNNSLETSLKSLYVCDASALPFSLGIPPMLTLIALTKWFVKNSLKN